MKTRFLMALCLLLTIGVAQVAANARQPDAPAAPLVSSSVYLPLLSSAATIDLTINRLDVSQAIQTPGQTVPFVSNRPTIVRAYLQAIGDHAVTGVYISFTAARGGVPIGAPLVVGPVTAPLTSSQGNYTSTVNVSLPGAWLSGNVTLTAAADPSGVIREISETNNQRSTSLAFNDVPPLDLKIVPIAFTQTPSGPYFPPVSTDPVSDFVRRTFPLSGINLSYRAPMPFSGNLSDGNDWLRLLNELTNLKDSDGAPDSQVYYGLIPTRDINGLIHYYNIGGIGWLGYRAAVGLDNLYNVGAHEIGHTFGRLHAPCGDVASSDPGYPYAGASIGNYGIDVYSNVLISPVAPDYAKDLMSYCNPPWVSDYTYIGLYNDQRAHGLVAARAVPAKPVLLVRARFDGAQTPELLPVYSLDGFPDETVAEGEYTIELVGREGGVIAAYPVRRYETVDINPPAYAIYAALPQPAQPIARIRLARAGTLLAERLMGDRPPLQALTQAPQVSANTVTLAWGRAAVPALVRYISGPDEPWTTLGVDVLGGRLTIDRSWLPEDTLRFEVIPADASTPVRYTLDVPAGR
jgi:hypothetical protein